VNPDRFAWEEFISVNQPVQFGKKDGVLWETWMSPEEVFANPNVAPELPSSTGKEIRPFRLMQTRIPGGSNVDVAKITFMHCSELSKETAAGDAKEVRLNDATVKFIIKKKLYNTEGQLLAASQGSLNFPSDSVEVKAAWARIDDPDLAKSYFTRTCHKGAETQTFGLISLHITRKAGLASWFWATFEHLPPPKTQGHTATGDLPRGGAPEMLDQCSASFPCQDSFGSKKDQKGTLLPTDDLVTLFENRGLKQQWNQIWRNYILVGTQIDFTQRPVLGNSILENQFKDGRSSCITCHSRATISDKGKRLNYQGGLTGAQQACWFQDNSNDNTNGLFHQTDFVWSLMLAKSTAAPTRRAKVVPNPCR